MMPAVAAPAGFQAPPVRQNTSPLEPPVPDTGMRGIETTDTGDNRPAQ